MSAHSHADAHHEEAAPKSTRTLGERLFIPEILHGLAVSARHFMRNLFGEPDRNPQVIDRQGLSQNSVVEYPFEKPIYPPGYRGMHRLVPRDDGKPRCVACYMCATVCPAQCIYIEADEYEVTDPSTQSRVIEKFPKQFVIDELRCVVCGLCVEACPKDAIRMDTYTHAPPEDNRKDFAWDIPRLLQGPPVSYPSDPWSKRDGSAQPPHVHKEAHTRVGEGLVELKLPAGGPRFEVTKHPIPVTKFLKP